MDGLIGGKIVAEKQKPDGRSQRPEAQRSVGAAFPKY